LLKYLFFFLLKKPSICVTNETQTYPETNNNIRYMGQFTEKLFRSRSQPMLVFNNRKFTQNNKVKSNNDSNCDHSDEDLVPFADSLETNSNFSQHFSPLKGLKAPVVDLEDI